MGAGAAVASIGLYKAWGGRWGCDKCGGCPRGTTVRGREGGLVCVEKRIGTMAERSSCIDAIASLCAVLPLTRATRAPLRRESLVEVRYFWSNWFG